MATDSAQLEGSQPSTAAEPVKPLPGPKRELELKRLGKYEIQKKIGAGGMGAVYLALDASLKRAVALKILPHEKAQNPTLVRRFHAEAQSAAALRHDNIVTVFEAGEADGYNFIALEFVDGIDADNLVRKRGVVPVKRSIEIVKQVARALEHAQKQGIVHRDIKPANLLIRVDGVVKLADLGLARSLDDHADMGITRVGTTVGTVDYMSPEQARDSKAADVRSDIYSLGCTWYHLLTGEPPFPGGGMANKLRDHATKPLPDPRLKNPGVSEGVVAILRQMTAKDAKQRYQTPAELLKDLDNAEISRGEVSQDILSQLARAEAALNGNEAPAAAPSSASSNSSAEFLAVITGAVEQKADSSSDESPSSAQTRDLPSQEPAPAPAKQKKKAESLAVKPAKKKTETQDSVPRRDTTRIVVAGLVALGVVALLGIAWAIWGSHGDQDGSLAGIDPSGRAGQTPEITPATPAQPAPQPPPVEPPVSPAKKDDPETPVVVRDDTAKPADNSPATQTPAPSPAPVTPAAPEKNPAIEIAGAAMPRVLPPRELLEPMSAQRTVRIDLTKISDLGKQLADQKLTTGTLVVVSGFGNRASSPIVIRDTWIRVRFEQADGPPLVITPRLGEYDRGTGSNRRDDAFISVSRGGVEFINATFSIPSAERTTLPNWLLQVTDGDFVLRNCRLLGPLAGTHRNKGLIHWVHGGGHLTARPFVGNHEAYALIIDSYLVGGGTLVDAEPRRRAMFWRNSIAASRDDLFSFRLTGPDSRIDAAVDLERCTLSAAGNFFRVEAAELGAPTAAPLTVVADRCVFGPPLRLASQKTPPTLLAYSGKLLEQRQLIWWETHCGYANDIACFLRPLAEMPSQQPFETAWTEHWGAGHVEKPLLGLGVILKQELPTDRAKLDAGSFELLEKSKAATWAPGGSPIGALLAAPNAVTKKPTNTVPSKSKPGTGF